MSRVDINFPTKLYYTFPYTLSVSDINYGGHMGNDAVLKICHDARLTFLQSLGHSELSFFGASLIQADAAIIYKNEAFFSDDIKVEIYLEKTSSCGFDMFYKLIHEDERPIAFAKTGIVFFDYDKKKVTRCPDKFISFIKE